MTRLRVDMHTVLTAWQWSPFSICVGIAVVAVAVLYLRGDWALAVRGRRWPGRRTLSFLAGLVAVDLALQSPVSTFTNWYFQAHIVQHLLLMAIAPPLLALGAPSTLLMQAGRRRLQTGWLRILRSQPFAVISHPVLVWVMYFGGMFAFFLTPLINYAMEHMAVMDVFNLGFLLGGCFYWWPMVGTDPIVHWKMGYGARIANLAIAVPFESFLGIAIMSDHFPIASMYTLSGTHSGGALLWASTELSTFAGLIPVFIQWARSEDREAARADARADARARALANGPALALPDQAQVDRAVSVLTRRPAFDPGAGERAGAGTTRALGTRPGQGAPSTDGAGGLSGAEAPDGGVTLASRDGSALGRRPGAGSAASNRFRPLFQPGNAAWEAMWKAKAGHAPGVGFKRNSPPGAPGTPEAEAPPA